MKELNVTKARPVGGWVFDGEKYYRAMEVGVLCNFNGHGGIEKVGDLIRALERLPNDAIFTIDEDEDSDRMGIFVNWNEWRVATKREFEEELRKRAEQVRADRELAANRKKSDALLRKAKRRQEIQEQLVVVRAAMDGVREELKNPHASEEEDLCADLETLETEETRLETELTNL